MLPCKLAFSSPDSSLSHVIPSRHAPSHSPLHSQAATPAVCQLEAPGLCIEKLDLALRESVNGEELLHSALSSFSISPRQLASLRRDVEGLSFSRRSDGAARQPLRPSTRLTSCNRPVEHVVAIRQKSSSTQTDKENKNDPPAPRAAQKRAQMSRKPSFSVRNGRRMLPGSLGRGDAISRPPQLTSSTRLAPPPPPCEGPAGSINSPLIQGSPTPLSPHSLPRVLYANSPRLASPAAADLLQQAYTSHSSLRRINSREGGWLRRVVTFNQERTKEARERPVMLAFARSLVYGDRLLTLSHVLFSPIVQGLHFFARPAKFMLFYVFGVVHSFRPTTASM